MQQPEETLVEVLRYARSCGYPTSRSQIRRYQQNGLIPKPRQVGLGRGRGTETLYPAETGKQLVVARKALKSKSLSSARWRLWWDAWGVRPEVIKHDLERLLRMQKWGNSKLPRNMRRRLRQDAPEFHRVFCRLRNEGNANGPQNEKFDESIVARGYGLDLSSISRMQRSGNLQRFDLLGVVASIVHAIAPKALRVALKSATTDDLLVARSELQSLLARVAEFLGLLDKLQNPIFGKMVKRAFLPFVELSPREEQLALIAWIAARDYPRVKDAYACIPGRLQNLRDNPGARRGP